MKKKSGGEGEEKLSSAAWEESSGGFWGLVKATHTCDRIAPRGRAGGVAGAANDWQKMSGGAHQLRVDTHSRQMSHGAR